MSLQNGFLKIFLRKTIQHEKHKVVEGEEEIACLRGQVEKLKEVQVLEKEKEK